MKKNQIISRLSLLLISLIFTLMLIELTNYIVIKNPIVLRYCPRIISNYFENLYKSHVMKYIQYDENCAEYDKELGYILKPGECTFSGVEFSNKFSINTMGLRDDEASLIGPQIIVLGDSYAMGWGVEDDETFASILEKKLGIKVLNAAVSSYGTVRELKILERLDLNNLKYLIIQYSHNDFDENKTFFDKKNKFDPMNLDQYLAYGEIHHKDIKYYFGKYTLDSIKSILNVNHYQEQPNAELETEVFLNALEFYLRKLNLKGLKIIIFNSYGDVGFTYELKEKLRKTHSAILSNDIVVLNPFNWKRSDFYGLDGHYTPAGHIFIAEELSKHIN